MYPIDLNRRINQGSFDEQKTKYSLLSNPINSIPYTLTRDGIIRASQGLRDTQGGFFYVSIEDAKSGLVIDLTKIFLNSAGFDAFFKFNGIEKFENQETSYFKNNTSNLNSIKFEEFWLLNIISKKTQEHGFILSKSITELNNFFFDNIYPKYEVKGKGKNAIPKFFMTKVLKYEKSTYSYHTPEGQAYIRDLEVKTNFHREYTPELLFDLRKHFIQEVRIEKVGEVDLYKIFPFDFYKEEFFINDTQCKNIFGQIFKVEGLKNKTP